MVRLSYDDIVEKATWKIESLKTEDYEDSNGIWVSIQSKLQKKSRIYY